MDIRTALEKNPNGLTKGQLLTITGRDFKSIKMALSRLPIEEHNGRYYLVLNPKHREQLRASFGNATSDTSNEPTSCPKIGQSTTLEVLDSQALEELILAERHAAVLIAQNNRSAMHLPSNQ